MEALRGPHQVLTDVFTYVARDDQGLSASAQITVTIYGANDAPRVIGLSSTVTNIDTLLLPSAQLQGLGYRCGGRLDHSRISGAPQHGTLRWTANGDLIYLPADGYVGTDTFYLTAHDGSADSATQAITIVVTLPSAMNGGDSGGSGSGDSNPNSGQTNDNTGTNQGDSTSGQAVGVSLAGYDGSLLETVNPDRYMSETLDKPLIQVVTRATTDNPITPMLIAWAPTAADLALGTALGTQPPTVGQLPYESTVLPELTPSTQTLLITTNHNWDIAKTHLRRTHFCSAFTTQAVVIGATSSHHLVLDHQLFGSRRTPGRVHASVEQI